MANVSGQGNNFNALNYLGEVFAQGTKFTTNFLELVGQAEPRRAFDLDFSLNQNYDLEAPAQKSITENASTTAPTATTYVRSQELQAVQIFQYTIDLTDLKLMARARMSGLNSRVNDQVVQDELAFQIAANLSQMRLDLEWHMLNGAYQKATNATTASQMRGILNDSNIAAVDASSQTLSRDLLDTLFQTMANNGARFSDCFLLVPASQKAAVDKAYAYEPTDRYIGGSQIQSVIHSFGRVNVLYVPNTLASTSVAVVDMAYVEPVFMPSAEGNEVYLEELAKTGMSTKHQLVTLASIDYTHGQLHGKITNLAA